MMSRMPPHEQFVRFAVASYSFPHLTQRAHLTFFNIITSLLSARCAVGFCSVKALLLFVPLFEGGRETKGYSLSKENTPLEPPEKGKGSYPLTPHIGSLDLEELHALRSVSAVYMASP